jgi:hypothetical protein
VGVETSEGGQGERRCWGEVNMIKVLHMHLRKQNNETVCQKLS